ncbi:hypothetical protein PSTG_08628 [Puccinia striiformis f. sp. tritici PST-78]|uniref:Uncharacterized protein n=1 Tax=Puccinia striiformis f. sp. tritici PST-78 TaxID=1165861 RepID=A0A0L0VGP1_9BASI|nr:hypothetical protein PSTG_08628 [Puccinia striiformis f. sp. tritici PST-78]
MNDAYKTFIDHGTTVNTQGYPLHPNGNTIFVQRPGICEATNFGKTAFTKRSQVRMCGNVRWKVTTHKCLGVLVCNIPDCQWAGSPPTDPNVLNELFETPVQCQGMAGKCPGEVHHIKCENTTLRIYTHVATE